MSEDDRTVWVGNLDSEQITEDLLYELFLQAGPLHYVRIPKDKESGRLKNFGFICYLHDVSVPYAIELFNGIELLGRNLRVQSRHLQEKQRQGLATGPGGVHSLDPDPYVARPHQQQCGQQSLMGAAPHMAASGAYMNNHMMPYSHLQRNPQQFQHAQQQQQQSILGQTPDLLRNMRGPVNNEMIAMARQQMALLNASQPNLFTTNPTLNTGRPQTSDRYGSVNYGNQYSNYQNNRNYGDDRSRGGGQRSIDNASMQDFKSRFDQEREDNAGVLSQQRKGNFDYSRLGSRPSYDNGRDDNRYNDGGRRNDNGRGDDNRYNDGGRRYDNGSRSNDNGSRSHDRYRDNGSRYNDNNRSRHDDRSNRYDNHSQSRHGRSRHDPYNRGSSSRY